jgi:hypothetical protein
MLPLDNCFTPLYNQGVRQSQEKGSFMEQKTIAVRLDAEQLQKLDAIVQVTGWNQSEVIRRLIDSASVTPPAVTADLSAKKEEPLVETHLTPEMEMA